jgi:hypothetical protein
VDLLGALDASRGLREFVRRVGGPRPDWANDPSAFERHFGVPIESYAEIVSHLSPEQEKLLLETLDVNPEAAVLWVLAMEEL